MRKFIYLFFSMVLFASVMNAQKNSEFTIFDLTNEDKDVYVWGASFDGKYSTGYINGGVNSFLWTKEDGIIQFDLEAGGSQSFAVSNNGIPVGSFVDSTYMYLNWLEISTPLKSAGYFKDGKWNSLGIKYENNFGETSGSEAYAISADGTVIGGSWRSVDDPESLRTAPVIWTINGQTITAEELQYMDVGNGAKILALSGDGSVAGGWADYKNLRIPAVWENGAIEYILKDGLQLEGEVNGISENGYYATLIIDGDAAIYDLRTKKLTIIPTKEGAFRSYALSISNDGIAVGYDQVGFYQADREAFIYSDKFGKFQIEKYIEKLGLDFEIPETFTFAFPSRISSDGKIVSGYGSMYVEGVVYSYIVGWAIEFEEHLDGLNPPKNLTGYERSYGNINISWESADSDSGHSFDGYNIYRDGIKINSTPTINTTYGDDNLSNGNYIYTVKAVWGGQESLPTREIRISTAELDLPFFDDFSDNGFDGKYWNQSMLDSERWLVVAENGLNPPAASYALPINNTYEESIISAYIKASDAQELYLSYSIAIPVKMLDWDTSQDFEYADSIRVEIFDGTNWNTIVKYNPYDSDGGTRQPKFEYKSHDISEYAGNIIRVRFTAYGENPGNSLEWNLDNINVYTPDTELVIEKPVKVSNYVDSKGNVHVTWADPNETVKLSYMEYEDAVGAVGNESVPFIAAILFNSKDLQGFDNYIMKEISVNLYRVYDEINDTAQYKLVAFQGEEKVLSQDIDSYIARDWNTFTLNTPLVIDATKSLYFGVEVTSHDVEDWPVGTVSGRQEFDQEAERMVNVNDGWSNLISEDNGQTWNTLTSYNQDLAESFAIKATIFKDENGSTKERILGYKVYRNNENILEEVYGEVGVLSILNNFLDNKPIETGTVCYEVSAYYDIQDESERSDETCIESLEISGYFPESDATDITIDTEVYVEFNMFISGNNLNGVTIEDKNGGLVTGVEAYIDFDKLRISHNDFKIDNQYTVKIPAGTITGITDEITWTFNVSKTSNINDDLTDKINIYPNPSSGLVNINVPENSKIEIIDITGRVIEEMNVTDNDQKITFTRTSGIYFIRIENNGKVCTKKLVIN